jgi:hypothetical protein
LVSLITVWGIISGLDGNTAAAQQPADPLIVNQCGDMWMWRGVGNSFKQSTTWIYNLFPPVLSPDGSKIAYKSYARVTADYLNGLKGGLGNYDAPSNIWILDPVTTESYRIADQQLDATWDVPETRATQKFILRSNPVWSPDSKSVAWTEYIHEPDKPDALRLVSYDLSASTVKVIIPGLPKQYDSSYPTAGLLWGRSAIAVLNITTPSNSKTEPNVEIGLYAPEGKALLSIPLPVGTITSMAQLVWITDQGREYLSYWAGSTWRVIDPATGKEADMVGVPELYSLTAPAGLSAFPNGKTWQIEISGQPSVNISGTYPFPPEARCGAGISISRDGQSVVYTAPLNDGRLSHTLTVYAGKKATMMTSDCHTFPFGIIGLVWGPTAWRVKH